MEANAFSYIAIGMTVLGMVGAALSIGMIFTALMKGISNNPEATDKMAKFVYVGAGLAESMGLFALVIALLLILK